MADFCDNSVWFRAETEKELVDFFNAGLKNDHPEYEPKKTLEEIGEWIDDFSQKNGLDTPVLKLSSWLPTPNESIESGKSSSYEYNLRKYSVKTDAEVFDDNYTFDYGCNTNDEGCKWYVNLFFTTPWSAPVNWIKELHKLFPNLCIELMYKVEDGEKGAVVARPKGVQTITDEYKLQKKFPNEFVDGFFAHDDDFDED